jgi:hypothetical protein
MRCIHVALAILLSLTAGWALPKRGRPFRQVPR